MARKKKVLKGVGISFLTLIVIAGIILGSIIWGFSNTYTPESDYIRYSKLKSITKDRVVYLSDEFMVENNLSISRFANEDDESDEVYEVRLDYNKNKYNEETGEGVESYSFFLINNDVNTLPITVHVYCSVGKKCLLYTSDAADEL